jgi:hypothetical protein
MVGGWDASLCGLISVPEEKPGYPHSLKRRRSLTRYRKGDQRLPHCRRAGALAFKKNDYEPCRFLLPDNVLQGRGGGTTSRFQSGKKMGGTAAMGRVFADEYPLPYLRLGFHLCRWSLPRAKPCRRGRLSWENYYVMRHYTRKREKRPVGGFVDKKGKIIRFSVSGGSTGFYKRPGGVFYMGL